MKIRYIFYIAPLIFFISGCISKKSQINSVSLSAGIPFEGKIENLFIVIDLPNNINYSEKLAVNLKEQLNIQNIKCESYIKTNKLDLNTSKEFVEMAVKSGASHIMTIDLFGQLKDDNFLKTLNYLSLNIYNLQGKIQYSATFNQDLRMIKNANQAKDDALIIIKELRKDNLLKE